MADHLAEQLLDALLPALTGLPTTGANVSRNRPDDDVLPAAGGTPALLLYLGAEDVETTSLDVPSTQRRDQQIRVGIRADGATNLDQTVNQIRKEVETALAAGVTLAGRVLYPVYAGMPEPERSAAGEKPVTAAELAFTFSYFTRSNAPDAYA